jgi:hypothetical protein
MASPQLQRLADSALLKVLQYVVTTVMVPAFVWYGGKTLDRLDRLEALLAQANVDRATTELRLQAVEKAVAAFGGMQEKVLKHEIELDQLRGHK